MSTFACFLPGEAVVHLRGREIPAFLQGQLSCDTRLLDADTAVMGAFCNVKGRVISDLTVILVDDTHCLLRLRASLAENVATKLQRYAQFSRISVAVDSADQAIVGLYDSPPERDRTIARDLSPLVVQRREGLLVLQRIGGCEELMLLDEGARSVLQTAVADCAAGSENHWRSRVLASGHYALELVDSEAFTPQALNFDRTRLVSFKKGCYTGQEVIARLHYKGKSKRRLGIYILPPSSSEVPRDAQITDSDGATCGRVLRCETDEAGLLLAAEVVAERSGETLRVADGPTIRPLFS